MITARPPAFSVVCTFINLTSFRSATKCTVCTRRRGCRKGLKTNARPHAESVAGLISETARSQDGSRSETARLRADEAADDGLAATLLDAGHGDVVSGGERSPGRGGHPHEIPQAALGEELRAVVEEVVAGGAQVAADAAEEAGIEGHARSQDVAVDHLGAGHARFLAVSGDPRGPRREASRPRPRRSGS